MFNDILHLTSVGKISTVIVPHSVRSRDSQMALSAEMRRLQARFATPGWPHFLEWIEIDGVRGWTGQRIEFRFPIVALVGENGAGKSTVLQTAAVGYKSQDKERFASDFFPDTPFEQISGATLSYSYKRGNQHIAGTVRKPTNRWRGNPDRPEREVRYVDLRRTQPVSARTGYAQLLRRGVLEGANVAFDEPKLSRLSTILGKQYEDAGISTTDAGEDKPVPVLRVNGRRYSGFHQGAGEITAAELLALQYPRYSLVLIDEVETSLHPRAQRRLIRDLATIARLNELQIILTTHSPYVLEELPDQARIYLLEGQTGKNPVVGVSPDFAMTRMDEEAHPECDIYVEDNRAAIMLSEKIVRADRDLLTRCKVIPFGSAQVGIALGIMVAQGRFPRPSLVYLDGDQDARQGCNVLPGGDVPERVVFEALRGAGWPNVAERLGRGPAETIDALSRAMFEPDHHMWVNAVGDRLVLGGDTVWQVLCSSWAINCATQQLVDGLCQPLRDALADS